MCTRCEPQTRAGPRSSDGRRKPLRDAAEEVALVAHAKRETLLRAHRHRLRREDLEDCYGQATLELVTRAREGAAFASRAHIANTLELKFVSRVRDVVRAIGGRSPMRAALETAASLDPSEQLAGGVADVRAEVEKLVILRHELERLERLARQLSSDQRLVLAWQLAQREDGAEFCRRLGWSPAKYRKVAQRARTRLSRLVREADAVSQPTAGVG